MGKKDGVKKGKGEKESQRNRSGQERKLSIKVKVLESHGKLKLSRRITTPVT